MYVSDSIKKKASTLSSCPSDWICFEWKLVSKGVLTSVWSRIWINFYELLIDKLFFLIPELKGKNKFIAVPNALEIYDDYL
jgi:hypothetical protein